MKIYIDTQTGVFGTLSDLTVVELGPGEVLANLQDRPDSTVIQFGMDHGVSLYPKPDIEILHTRDPDGGCEHTVFLNGERLDTQVSVEDIDAGRGYTREDWDEHTQWVTDSGYTKNFKAAVLAEREHPPGSKYIEED